jgi:hypothetical protein
MTDTTTGSTPSIDDDVLKKLLDKIEDLEDDARKTRIVHLVVAAAVALCVVAQFGVMKPLIGIGIALSIAAAIWLFRWVARKRRVTRKEIQSHPLWDDEEARTAWREALKPEELKALCLGTAEPTKDDFEYGYKLYVESVIKEQRRRRSVPPRNTTNKELNT